MGRDKRSERQTEHFTKLIRQTMQTEAWRALSPYAQAVYPWIKLEWRGPSANNNGRIQFSVRQAAYAVGINRKTAARAFHDLQAKGFLVMTSPAKLGLGGQATSPCWEITEIAMPNAEPARPRSLFREWRHGRDFPVHKAAAQNPRGRNGADNTVRMKVVG